MIAILVFLVALGILLAEGCMLSMLILGYKTSRWVQCPFALPLAAISNVLLILLYTIFGIPLTVLSLLIGHLLLIAIIGLCVWKWSGFVPPLRDYAATSSFPLTKKFIFLRIVCGVLLSITFVYSFTHAVILPSFQVDSFSNWTMRAKVSFTDQRMAFDHTEARGIAKPQYPFLVHALQITANQGQGVWSDRIANTMTFLLTLSGFFAIFTI